MVLQRSLNEENCEWFVCFGIQQRKQCRRIDSEHQSDNPVKK